MKKSPTSAPHSPQPSTSTSSPRHPDELEKDEQLQLCIQRFVSDAQSMIQEFNSLFIGEVRRFADVCIEFSLAYRSVHEERDFLAIENQSLKDELEARGGQLEMISKELRETREENEELVRRLECLGVPPGGSFESGGGSPILVGANSIRMDPVAMSRHYAVVNSMPAFPRRYSVATSVASYDDNAPTSYLSASHAGCSSASPTISYTGPNSATNSNTLLLITPPVDFKSGTTSPVSPLPEVPMEVKRKSASLSRDDIHAYFNKYNQQVVDTTKQRSPSLDQIPASSPIPIPDVQSPTDPLSMSSSAGTFYDCVSTCSMEVANPSNPQNLTEEINRMCALMVAQSGELTKEMPPMSQESTFSEYLERSDRQNSFIPKSPSLQSTNYLHHFQLYMSKSHDDAREAAFASGSELTEIETSSSGQIPRSNFQKKKNSIKDTASAAELIQETKWYSGHGTSGSLDLLDHSVYHREFPDLVTIIPLPLLELTRYLLVEVSHFISPSHFYLIVNDEKCGSNAFEDFLESFQNFYKSLDYLLEEEQQQQHQNGFVDDPDETEADSEWKLYFTSPPAPDAVTIGSYWAGYLMIYDDYEWRRIQVIQLGDDQADAKIELPEMMAITVRDVDSGYSTAISISALRPLTEEFGSIPAFAIRASLAYLYPRPHRSPSTGSLQPEDTASVWPEECCLLFEKLSYDRVLTASIIEIQREELTDTEIAQVLLWCSPSSGENQEDEIFINRKLIELNFAANVAEDDQWLLRSNESMNCASTKSSQILKQSEMQPEILPEAPTPELPDTPITKKKKLKKTTSKKKKESGHSVIPAVESEVIREDAPKPETLRPELYGEPNVLLGEPLTSSLPSNFKSSSIEICTSFYLSSSSLHHLDSHGVTDVSFCKFPLESCSKLHHDPRLSNWIVQKHSRQVKLKKSSHMTSNGTGGSAYPTMCYPFRVTTVFDMNKFIGILPFGERKLDTEAVKRFITQMTNGDASWSKSESPFRSFVHEMTEFYQKFSKEHSLVNSSANSTFLETFLQNQHQNQMIAFYDSAARLFLRGYIVGKDPDTPRSEPRPGSSHALNTILSPNSKSSAENSLNPEIKRKTLSLKRPKVKFSQVLDATVSEANSNTCSKLIIYGIDTGRYYLVNSAKLFKLVDQFVSVKPFAIVCKLLLKQNADGTPSTHSPTLDDRVKFSQLIADRLLCLQFHGTDFASERNLVELYLLNLKESSYPQNILNL